MTTGLRTPGAGFLPVNDGQGVASDRRPRWDLNAETTTAKEVNAISTASVIQKETTAIVGQVNHTNGAT